jgi:hypothetical protein
MLSQNVSPSTQVASTADNDVTSPTIAGSSSTTPVGSNAANLHSSTPSVNPTAGMSSVDLQSQMMMMLTESFTKLSTVLVDKSQDNKMEVKSEWPKFAGDIKKFKSWYLSIVAQLSIPPWQEFYDQATHSVVSSTTNTVLNGKLYAKLLVSLEGQAL